MQQDDKGCLESCQSAVGASRSTSSSRPTSVPANPRRSSQADTHFQMKIACLWFSGRGYHLVCGMSELKRSIICYGRKKLVWRETRDAAPTWNTLKDFLLNSSFCHHDAL